MFHLIQTYPFIEFAFNFICNMNLRVWSLTAITLAVCLASSALFVNSSFAEESEARKAMKAKIAQQDAEKKKKTDDKKKAIKDSKIKVSQAKLAKYQAKLAKDPTNQTLQKKIAKINAQITALKNKP